ncbi:hypothetical protein [Mesorhizobium xinjiangense]|uniref:hypothetical protein n=1 Tax=Mesorhizobium xinjiangense TaxID=2678685 RepID=UPI0012ED3EE1|nr:hypothetical protein [Mesorhizobium xinjiangense]
MGFLDLPASLLAAIDNWMAPYLPAALRLILWAAIGAVVSMELYRLLSPQVRIAETKKALAETQRYVAGFDGEFHEAWPHLRRMMSLAFHRIGLVVPATLAASLPILAVIVWLGSQYGVAYPPPGQNVPVVVDGDFKGRWVHRAEETPHAVVMDRNGGAVADVPVSKPVPVIHKRQWWNMIIGNPAGYLDDDLPFNRIDISLPHQQVLAFGPAWLRRWEVIYFAAMIIIAFAFKSVRRIA